MCWCTVNCVRWVKAINENLLTCGCVRVYAYARDARAFVHLIGEGNGKVGRKEKESGGVVKRVEGLWGGREVDREIKVGQGVKSEGSTK